MNATDAYGRLVSIASENRLIERLFFASLEFAALALLVGSLIFLLRLKSARLTSILWLLVLAKPLVSLAVGSPIPIVWLLPPSSQAVAGADEVKPTAATIEPTTGQVVPEAPLETRLAPQAPEKDARAAHAPVSAAGPSPAAGSAPAASPRRPLRWPEIRTGEAIVGIWLIGVACFTLVELLCQIRTRRLVASSTAPSSALSDHFAELAKQLCGRRKPSLRITDRFESPALVGVLRPVILIPAWLAGGGRQDPSTLTWSLRHELMHCKLGDPVASLVPRVAQVLFFFHPVAWWAGKRWRAAMELACDRALVATEAEAGDYAEGLYRVLAAMQNRRRLALAPGLFATRTQIGRRIEVLLNGALNSSARLSAMMVVGVGALSVASLAIGGRFADEVLAERQPEREASSGDTRAEQDTAGSGQPSAPKRESAGELGDPGEQTDRITVKGRVLGPDGKPFAGAEVSLWWHFGYWAFYGNWHPQTGKPMEPRLGATSGPDGRFRFTLAKSEIYDNPMNIWEDCWVQIEAAAEGYGPGWGRLKGTGEEAEMQLRLVQDDVPIKGRVVDPQGHPVAGAGVWVERVTIGRDEFHSLWRTAWTGWPESLTTDQGGRFTLTGVGRDRNVLLHVAGPDIEHKLVWASTDATRDGKRVESAQVEVVARPTKPIVGTIRANDTGEPLPGVVVYGGEKTYRRGVRAVTDAEGRYRLVGLPKAEQYELTVYPPMPLGYLGTLKRVGDTGGLQPLAVDLELRRGVEVRVRWIDKVTHRPVRGNVLTTPLRHNPYYREAELEPHVIPTREWERVYAPDTDGVFHLVVYPGPSLLCFRAQGNTMRYLPARITPADRDKSRGDPMMGFAELSRGYRIIDAKETDDPLVLEVELDPGRTVEGTLIGPGGQPVAGATAYGLNYNPGNLRNVIYKPEWENEGLTTGAFSVRRLEYLTPRTVSFIHKDRKLIGYVMLEGDEEGSLDAELKPWGTVTGRLLDEEGKALKGVSLKLEYPQMPDPGMRPWDEVFQTDADGRFRVEGLATDLKHGLVLTQTLVKDSRREAVTYSAGDRLKDLTVPAGEVSDLGDVRVRVAKREYLAP